MKALTNKKGKFKLAGTGRIPYTYEHETDIMKFIKIARAHNIAVNTLDIIKEAIKYYPEMKNKSYSSQMKWCYRFLKRWSYTIRRATHVGRKIKVKALDDLANFYLILKDIKLKQKIFS